MKKIVLTGPPHSGKTTLIEELLDLGHQVVPETAITVIEALNDLLGPAAALKWRRGHFNGFQELISERQSYMEQAVFKSKCQNSGPSPCACECKSKRLVFLDRGAHDGIAFARHFQKAFPEKASEYIVDTRYDQVFLLDLVLPFSDREGTGRVEDEEDCKALHKHLFAVYDEIGLTPIIVPVMPVEERLNFILERI